MTFLLAMTLSLGCAKTFVTATPTQPVFIKKTFTTNPNDLYYALRWAMRTNGYPLEEEDLQNGVLKSRFVPTKVHSHYLDVFGRKDFGTTGAYHQLEVHLTPQSEGTTEVQIGSRIQSTAAYLKSSGLEEKMILEKVADYLRNPSAQITNLGLRE